MAKVCVILSGSGVFDGSEIHETVLSLYFLQKAGVDFTIAAPDKPQMHVINHMTGDEMDESRNVMIEAARIARGKIVALSNISARDFDGIFIPGGFGAAKNLSTFAVDGADAEIDPDVMRVVTEAVEANKPIAAICIAPVILAKVLPGLGKETNITLGAASGASEAAETMGASHTACPVTEFVVDEANKVITSPAYMYDAKIIEVAEGIEKTVKRFVQML